MAEETVAVAEAPETTAPEVSSEVAERYMTPPVDILETAEGLVLVADVPGVSQDDLEVSVDRNVLTLRGHASYVSPGKEEVTLPSVFRKFRLSEGIDTENIGAELKHGVLRLHLPKAGAAKARQIEIKAS